MHKALLCRGRNDLACVTSARITTRWMGKAVDGVVGGRRAARWNPAPVAPKGVVEGPRPCGGMDVHDEPRFMRDHREGKGPAPT